MPKQSQFANRPPFVVEVGTKSKPNLTPEMPALPTISPYKRDATQITLRDLDMRSRSLSSSQNRSLIASFKKEAHNNSKKFTQQELDGFKYWKDKITKLKQPMHENKEQWSDCIPLKNKFK